MEAPPSFSQDYMKEFEMKDIGAVMRIVRNLKGTSGRGILFKNADWAGDRDERKSPK